LPGSIALTVRKCDGKECSVIAAGTEANAARHLSGLGVNGPRGQAPGRHRSVN